MPLHHWVYAIHLDPTAKEVRQLRRTGRKCVAYYVGMTGLHPHIRYAQHIAGIRSNNIVRRHGVGLSTRHISGPYTFEDAQRQEQIVAEQFRANGCAVVCG